MAGAALASPAAIVSAVSVALGQAVPDATDENGSVCSVNSASRVQGDFAL